MIADSLSVTLLLISLPCLPIFGRLSFNHLSIRSAFCRSLSVCLLFSHPRGGLIPGSSSSSFRSTATCSSTNDFTFFSIRSFFLVRSLMVPLQSLEALEGSLQPSNANNVPPISPSSSHTYNTPLNMGLISSFIEWWDQISLIEKSFSIDVIFMCE